MDNQTLPEVQITIEDFPNKLKDLRRQKSMTQQELADKLSTSQQVVSALEKGKIDPSLKVLSSIAVVLGVVLIIVGAALWKGGSKE